MLDCPPGGNGGVLSVESMRSFIHEVYVAVRTFVCPFRSADFLEEVVRAGLLCKCGW